MREVAIYGAGAVSPRGVGWRDGGPRASGFAVPELSADQDVADLKARRLMSRAARFAAIAAREALAEAGLAEASGLGFWLGVGASGGPLEEIAAMLAASRVEGRVSLSRLGTHGLAQANPLSTFQVLNNFTMCHAAMACGTRGPNGAFFSRGAGTLHALREAMHAVADGDCEQALAGGADTALHPVTQSELEREGFLSRGLQPSEGAGILLLGRLSSERRPLAIIEHADLGVWRKQPGAVVLAAWGPEAQRELAAACKSPTWTWAHGEALAATPALAWTSGLARLAASEQTHRVLVLTRGPDGETVSVVLRRPS